MKLKKGILFAICLSTVQCLLIGSVSANINDLPKNDNLENSSFVNLENSSNVTIQNDLSVLDMKNFLLGKEDLVAEADINADGILNVFDLVSLKQDLFKQPDDTGELVTANYSATADNVKLIGRNLVKNDITWLVQSGSAVEFEITGTSAEIQLAGDGAVYSDEKYRPRYAVLVDGEVLTDSLMSTEKETIILFEGESSRKATVKVIHLSEANNGAIGVSNISVTSSAKKPVVPVAKKDLSIEFIGDSITCAYGVEGETQYEPFSTSTENFMKSYAYLTAQQLNADYSAVCYSGHGIISGYTTDEKNTDSLVPDCYNLVGKSYDYATEWDFESNPNDVVVINLGTNDSSYLSLDFEARSGDFVDGYVSFLKDLRDKNPNAYIICTVGTMGGEDVYGLIEQAIGIYKSETEDTNVMGYLSATQNMANGLGADWHPSVITQQESAYVLADKICEVLGMESSKIGLDFTADSPYDVVINEEAGANASFFVAYDKSFWINMVGGGTQASDIKACISDIDLKTGEYRLEFNCKTGISKNIPFSLQNDTEVYYSDSVDSELDDQLYSAIFTVTENADDCEIVFNIGGSDYYSVTLANIRLVKLS